METKVYYHACAMRMPSPHYAWTNPEPCRSSMTNALIALQGYKGSFEPIMVVPVIRDIFACYRCFCTFVHQNKL